MAGRRAADWLAEAPLIGLVALLLMLPSLLHGLPNGDSVYLNRNWHDAFVSGIAAGDLYPRFLPSLWTGAGGFDFYFYPPLAFWMSAALALLVCGDCTSDGALALAGTLMLAASGLAFRSFARRYASRMAALAGALAYMALPYHLGADWVDRQALGEFLAFALVPLHVAAVIDGLSGRLAPVGLALLTGLLCLAHMPTLVILGLFHAVLALAAVRPVSLRALGETIAAGLLGLGLAGFFLAPALLLLGSVRPDLLQAGPVQWQDFLLTADNWRAQRPFFREIWTEFALLSLPALVAARLAWRDEGTAARLILVSFAVAMVMNLPASTPVWSLEPVAAVQFGFRFFVLTDLAVALGIALLVEQMRRGRRLVPGLATGLVAAVALADLARGFPPDDGGRDWRLAVRSGAIEWMGRGLGPDLRIADLERLRARPPVIAVPEGAASVRIMEERPRELVFAVAADRPVEVSIKRTWWRHWRLSGVDGEESIAHRPGGDFPLVRARLPDGEGVYRLHLPTLAAERIGLLLTLASLGCLGAWWVARWRRAR